MATTAKTTTAKKTQTKRAVAKEEVVEVNTKVVEPQETKIEEKATPRKFNPDDLINCRSITIGGLYLDGVKSNNFYSFVEYGDEVQIEYRDLAAMVRSRSSYIFSPLFVIDDEDFVNEFPQLKKFYDDQYSIQDLEGVLKLPVKSMVATIKTLPPGALNSLKSIASTQVVSGQLDSMQKIKALDEIFDTELNMMAAMSK